MSNHQDPQEIRNLVHSLEQAKGNRKGGKKGYSCKKSTYHVAGSDDISVDSWRFNDWDYKRADLPTYARGLFTARRKNGTPEIVIRGYDKFFNVGEVRSTEWSDVERNTVGPYELSVKENGCIIFMSGLEDGTLLVCSKHSTGNRNDVELSHAQAGERWVKKHLASVGKTTTELAQELRRMNVTAVGELCDDTFEEHVLEYPPDQAGLYLHGINFNLPEFATLSGPEVHHFADSWGFKKAQYVIIQDLDEVKSFLDKCAETGSWDGRDTEGFVVRCKRKLLSDNAYQDWFFKYKFEEPYLMYRQWREATKSAILGKPPKIKKHKQITEQYLNYAKRQLAQNPKLAKEYNQNHGIIAMRDGFLQEIGKKGSDIIAQEIERGEDSASAAVTEDVVLVPVASIGCGKTTVALALVHLFGWGHVQNDNIEGKGNRPKRFASAVTNALAEKPVVIADRNNHQKRERKQVIEDVQAVVPKARCVALQYVHEPKGVLLPDIRKVTRRRVLDRGDNHQTIRAGSKGEDEIVNIMEGFLSRFEAVDTDRDPDDRFDEVIDLDISAESLENLETIINKLYSFYPKLFRGGMPTHEDMANAIEWALKNYTVDTKHDLSFGRNKPNGKAVGGGRPDSQSEPMAPAQLVKRLEYFGIPVSTTNINSTLAALFHNLPAEEARMYQLLKQSRRIQPEFHVTLIHRVTGKKNPDMWQKYTDLYLNALTQGRGERTPSLGGARVRLERVVWDTKIMTFVVRILPPEHIQSGSVSEYLACANDIPHITVGTAHETIKPKESNDLLRRWLEGDESGEKIWEREVPGMRVLEGTVRPVLQRGR
ncbi:putative trna ligase [Phaeomoniella chlamydospora]|uniref:tRNA ligase n=1 Tax=Phaeomoniella chlamydospora TaxID=158046 RepID=A0A0G2GNH1_PHACM|nr:putative trna ligase [Phaeomoniella chlamydospora]